MDKPDVEEVVIAWLGTIVPEGWTATGDKPEGNDMPTQFITVDRTGGPREAMVLDRAEILIEVYHKTSRVEAKNVARLIANRIVELEAVHDVTHASINSVVNLDDTIAQYKRYQVYCDVSYRE